MNNTKEQTRNPEEVIDYMAPSFLEERGNSVSLAWRMEIMAYSALKLNILKKVHFPIILSQSCENNEKVQESLQRLSNMGANLYIYKKEDLYNNFPKKMLEKYSFGGKLDPLYLYLLKEENPVRDFYLLDTDVMIKKPFYNKDFPERDVFYTPPFYELSSRRVFYENNQPDGFAAAIGEVAAIVGIPLGKVLELEGKQKYNAATGFETYMWGMDVRFVEKCIKTMQKLRRYPYHKITNEATKQMKIFNESYELAWKEIKFHAVTYSIYYNSLLKSKDMVTDDYYTPNYNLDVIKTSKNRHLIHLIPKGEDFKNAVKEYNVVFEKSRYSDKFPWESDFSLRKYSSKYRGYEYAKLLNEYIRKYKLKSSRVK